MAVELTLPDGTTKTSAEVLDPWLKRKESGHKARKPFEKQWMLNQAFAAGRQWAVYNPREHRVLDDPRRREAGRSMQTADVLTQYVWTAIGKLAADDFRPQLLFQHEDRQGELYAEQANKAFGWGWEEEWKGDQALLDLLLALATFGTAAIRCQYDRNRGAMLGPTPLAPDNGHTFTDPASGQEHAFKPGEPILHAAAARDYVASAKYYGEQVQMQAIHEGAVSWEVLTPWNLLTPPAVENEAYFPWEIVVRPVALEDLRALYGDKAQDIESEGIDAMSVLGLRDSATPVDDKQMTPSLSAPKLEEHALVYTGYAKPCPDYPHGQKVVWAGDTPLDVKMKLPLDASPWGPRSGITYFRYWSVKQRFWGRALIEPGMGSQRVINKRVSQMDETLDKGQPKVFVEEGTITQETSGTPLETVSMKPGAPLPKVDPGVGVGDFMHKDVELHIQMIERGLGLHGISLGVSPAGASPYAALALQTENDAVKLDPIAKEFKLAIADVSRDSLELMRNWPDGRQLMIAGDDDTLDVVTFKREILPPAYMVRPAKGTALPRSQGAELQKINDIWQAALAAKVPLPLQWYFDSLSNGKAEPLPESMGNDQRHKAALENVIMAQLGQNVPVAPYDDAQIHAETHREQQIKLSQAAQMGDQRATQLVQVFEQHIQEHLQQAQQNAATNAASAPPPGAPPPGAPPAPASQPPAALPVAA